MIIDNTPSHDVLLLRKARQKDQRPPPINTQKLKDPKVMRTFQQKVQNKFSLFMIKSNEIDLETINDVLLENGQQILGPREKKEDGSQTPRGKKKNRQIGRAHV